jgi:hypothetical protein
LALFRSSYFGVGGFFPTVYKAVPSHDRAACFGGVVLVTLGGLRFSSFEQKQSFYRSGKNPYFPALVNGAGRLTSAVTNFINPY